MVWPDYKLSLIAAIIVVCLGSTVGIAVLQGQGASAQTFALVGGLATPTVVSLLALLRAETNGKDVGTANAKLDTVQQTVNGHLTAHDELLRQAIAAIHAANPPVETGALEAAIDIQKANEEQRQ